MSSRKPTYEELEKRVKELEEEVKNLNSLTFPEFQSEEYPNSEIISIKNKFWLLTELSPIAMYVTDSEGACIYVNKKWRELAGLSLDEAMGDGWQRGLHPDDREYIFKKWREHSKKDTIWSPRVETYSLPSS